MSPAIEFPDLARLVMPRSILLVGASEKPDSIGARTLENLTRWSQWPGELTLVNPGRDEIAGRRCLRSIDDVELPHDVAILAVRADGVLEALEQCGRKGTRFAIVFTSGFGETGDEGRAVEARMKAIVRATGMRIYGPNCPGLNNVNGKLGMTFSPALRTDRLAGPIGVATQGGGLGRSFIQSMDRGIGTGVWFSGGNEVDLEVSDYIRYMADAPDLRVIVTTLEGVRDGPRFMTAALHAARRGKPIVALKIGKSEYGAKAAQSHTAAIAGSAQVNSAVMRELGIVEVDDVDELADVASLLARRMPTGRERIAVYSFSGGTVALTADRVGTEQLELAQFAPATIERLAQLLPAYAAFANPVDVTAEILVNATLIDETLRATAQDPNTDLVLVPIPVEYGRTTELLAQGMVRVQREVATPIVPIWMSDRTGEGHRLMIEGGLMPMRSVRNAIRALRRYVDHGRWRASFDADWTPAGAWSAGGPTRNLVEPDAKALLSRVGIPVPAGVVARTAEQAIDAFESLGARPVAMKVVSAGITHKTDVGGVRLGVADAAAVALAFDSIVQSVRAAQGESVPFDGILVETMLEGPRIEVVAGFHRDPVFGHVCTFGLGGVAVELFKDVSRRLLPLTPASARGLIEETRSRALLTGHRGQPPFDVDALVRALLALGELVMRNAGAIEELEINPLAVRPAGQGVVALDAVVTLSGNGEPTW